MFTISRLYNITLFKVNNFDLNIVRYTPLPPPRAQSVGCYVTPPKIFLIFFVFLIFSFWCFVKKKSLRNYGGVCA